MANALATSIATTPGNITSEPGAPARRRPLGIIRRVALWAFGAGAAFVLIMGLLHTRLGAPLLAKLGVGCPIRPGTPEEVDRARMFGAAFYAGKPGAPARPALGFVFEKTTIAEVEAWAEKNGVSCEKINGTETLRSCSDVPASAVGQPAWFGPVEYLTFGFHANRTLSTVSTMRRKLSVPQANAITAEIAKNLGGALGAPSVTGGENTPQHFAKGSLQAYKEEWAFGDYGATLREVRLADTGVMVRENYISPVPLARRLPNVCAREHAPPPRRSGRFSFRRGDCEGESVLSLAGPALGQKARGASCWAGPRCARLLGRRAGARPAPGGVRPTA